MACRLGVLFGNDDAHRQAWSAFERKEPASEVCLTRHEPADANPMLCLFSMQG
jgi:hypothetical protein